MNRFQSIIITASTAIFGLSIAIYSHVYSQQQTILNLALEIEVKDRRKVEVLPRILSLGKNADNQQNAIAYYNLAINTADKLDRLGLSQTEKEKVDRALKIATNARDSIATKQLTTLEQQLKSQQRDSIATKQLTTLEQQLKSQQIGEINSLIAGEFENQYS